MNATEKARIEQVASAIRVDILETLGVNRMGHVGGSASCAEIVAALYFYKLRHDPKNPNWKARDRFLLSKGHACLTQYSALARAGYFSHERLTQFKELGSPLQGHPERGKVPGVEANTGSLGQGLSVALGMALGLRLDDLDSRVYVLLGDGELAEGQVWEAAMAAAAYKTDNLIAIVDWNGLACTGTVDEIMPLAPLKDKWEAFGWHVLEIDGHDVQAICDALDAVDSVTGKPKVILARTVKGKGFRFAENQVSWHNAGFSTEQYEIARRDLEAEERGHSRCRA